MIPIFRTAAFAAAITSLQAKFPALTFEHLAVHMSSAGLLEEIKYWERRGYEYRDGDGTMAFLQHKKHPERRIELIEQEIEEHVAFAVPKPEQFVGLKAFLHLSDEFEMIEGSEIDRPDLDARLYLHVPSGEILQIIRRKNPIFKGVFKKEA